MNKRFRFLLSAVLAFSLAFAGLATAHPWFDDGGIDSGKSVHGNKHAQHGKSDGHLPATRSNVDLVSKLKLKNVVPEKIADVGVHEGYAYVAAWGVVTCKYNGIHVVDVRRPANPKEVHFIGAKAGSYPGEGVQALSVTTSAFQGDILVTNNEKCNDTSGFGGINLYDVTNPQAPTPLYEGFGDEAVSGTGKKNAHETHSAFVWDAGTKAYAAMVDNEEAMDVDIVDITNPRKPRLIAEYDLAKKFPSIVQAKMPEVFLHDMVVKKIGGRQVMLLGYWDAGYVQIDVTNPTNISLVGDSTYANPDPEALESGYTVPPEGNGHQAEFTKDSDFVIGTDEDFAPYRVTARDGSGQEFPATMGVAIEPGSTLTGDLVYVGRGCNTDAMPGSTAAGQIAFIERGACAFTEKVANADAAGYVAAVVFNSQAAVGGTCTSLVSMSVSGDIPALFVARDTAFGFMGLTYNDAACNDADAATGAVPASMLGQVVERISVTSQFDGWGYVHLFDRQSMRSLDTYAIDEAHDEDFAIGFGDLSVHEVATSQRDNSLAYYAYYSGGFRVTRIVDGELVEVGRFIDQGGNNIWGVEVFTIGGTEYVAASDRDLGLYIFKTKGAAAPVAP